MSHRLSPGCRTHVLFEFCILDFELIEQQRSASKAQTLRRRSTRRDLHCAVLELRDLHPLLRIATARRRQNAFVFDLDHARAAVSVGAHPLHVAEARNVDALGLCNLKNGLIRIRDNGLPVEREGHHHSTSEGKYFSTDNTGFGAAWPSPQIEASVIACDSSSSSGLSQCRSRMRSTAFWVPTRHGVHCPHDSSAKNLITFLAAAAAVSLSDSTTIAAEPMKQPYGLSVWKSRGTFANVAGRMPPDAPPGRYPYRV